MDKIPIPNDWNEETDGYAFVWFCIPNSPLWRGVVRGKIYEMTRGRIWDEVTGNIKDTQAIAWEIYEGICMACGDELLAKLERIAVAIESIDEKAVQRVTWEEMMTDLAETLGVTHAIYKTLKWFGDLFPRVKLYVDVGPYVLGLLEWARWKAPIIGLLTTANASLATIAAAQVAEKPLSLLRTIFAGFDSSLNLNNRIYEFILGDWNWYDDVFKPLWDSFISDDDGGTGGDDPDADPANRNITRVYNDVFVEGDAINVTCAPDVTVNCGGSGGGGYGTPGDGGLGGQFEPPSVDDETEFEVDQDKCDRVTHIANEFITHIRNVASIAGMTDIAFATGMAFFMNSGGLAMFALAGVGVAFLLGSVVIAAIIGAIVGASLLVEWADDLEAGKEDFICAAYNAVTQPELKQAVRDWIEATIPSAASAWTDKYVDFVASGGVCAWVFTGEGFTPEDLEVGDCDACVGECELVNMYPEVYPSTITKIDANTWEVEAYDYQNRYPLCVWFADHKTRTLVSCARISGTPSNSSRYTTIHYCDGGELEITETGFVDDGYDDFGWIASVVPIENFSDITFNYFNNPFSVRLVFSDSCENGCDE